VIHYYLYEIKAEDDNLPCQAQTRFKIYKTEFFPISKNMAICNLQFLIITSYAA